MTFKELTKSSIISIWTKTDGSVFIPGFICVWLRVVYFSMTWQPGAEFCWIQVTFIFNARSIEVFVMRPQKFRINICFSFFISFQDIFQYDFFFWIQRICVRASFPSSFLCVSCLDRKSRYILFIRLNNIIQQCSIYKLLYNSYILNHHLVKICFDVKANLMFNKFGMVPAVRPVFVQPLFVQRVLVPRFSSNPVFVQSCFHPFGFRPNITMKQAILWMQLSANLFRLLNPQS